VAITAPAPGHAHLGENAKMNPPLNGACHTTLGPGRTRSLCPPRTDSRCFFTRLRRRRMCADSDSALDPRSLASATLLRVRTAGLFEVRHRQRLLQLHYDVRAPPGAAFSSLDEGRNPLPFRPATLNLLRRVVTELRAARVPSRSPRRPFPLLAQDCGRSMRSPTRHLREVF